MIGPHGTLNRRLYYRVYVNCGLFAGSSAKLVGSCTLFQWKKIKNKKNKIISLAKNYSNDYFGKWQ